MDVLKVFEHTWVRPLVRRCQPRVSRGGCNTLQCVKPVLTLKKKKCKVGEAHLGKVADY